MNLPASTVLGTVDRPAPGGVVSARGLTVTGWTYRPDGAALRGARATVAGAVVGSTRVAYVRDDVNAAYGLPNGARAGFDIYVDALPLDDALELVVSVDYGDGDESLATVAVRTSPFDASGEHYGALGDPAFDVVLHRANIYSVGPPSPVANPECVGRLVGLTSPEETIVDVGCGIGAYAEPLLAAGRSWHGCEVVGSFVDAMRERGLDVTQASGTTLPFADASFDVAISIEVLEHIDDYAAFVAELARVSRRGAILSVPNAGAIPRYAPLGVVPWHLLEGSHVNFFTVASLRGALAAAFAHVEVVEYGALPLPTIDGTPVFNHLLAVALHDDDRTG